MSAPVPVLAPLFRSDGQMRLLAELFHGEHASGAELSRRTGIPQSTVARELARLEAAGLVEVTAVGNARFATIDINLPYYSALRQLLAYVGGVIPELVAMFEPIEEVSEVFIFGSWAQRYHGATGPPPNDVDVAVVSSTLTRFDLAEPRLAVERVTGMNIDLHVFGPTDARLAELREGSVAVFGRRR